MLPKDPDRPDAPHGTIEDQVERALRNVEAVLRAGGSGLEQLLSVTIYVILDLEYPRVGLLRLDATEQVLVELRQSMG